jgi:regulatory subunit for Cdc7p protein kinase
MSNNLGANKRLYSFVNQPRLPLQETTSNIPLPHIKKQKLAKPLPVSTSTNVPKICQHEGTESAITKLKNSGRLSGKELYNWQQSWRKIMKESKIYFEGIKESNPVQLNEFKKASKLLKQIGSDITPFFDNNVTIIVLRRPFNQTKLYPSNDIFSNVNHHKIKVWDYDKVFRFLKNLGVNTDESQLLPEVLVDKKGNLHNLLKDEKIFGSNDRDPNAKRDDLHYLEKNYLFVFDLQQKVRPIAVREWHDDSYPSIHYTMDGKCPFIAEVSENSDRKKLRRQLKFDATKEYREMLKQATMSIMNNIKHGISMSSAKFKGTSTSTDKIDDETTIVQNTSDNNESACKENENNEKQFTVFNDVGDEDDFENYYDFKQPDKVPTLNRNSSCMVGSISRQFDVASGYNGASNAMSFSMDSTSNSNTLQQGGNGLGPITSQVPSRNINNLKRRIIIKKQQEQRNQSKVTKRKEELNPGYCENCRVKYDHFEDHMVSNRHRNFACDDRNFKDIDNLSETLKESRSLGFIASNGDYM